MRYKALADVMVVLITLLLLGSGQVQGDIVAQFTPDIDGIDTDGDGNVNNDHVMRHLGAGDGFVRMADGKGLYIFGFTDVTGVPDEMYDRACWRPSFPPRRWLQGRPAGVPEPDQRRHDDAAGPVRPAHGPLPRLPAGRADLRRRAHGAQINMGRTFPYYYKVVEPGTFMYHCHVEATEHMQMGMLGNLWVLPKQNNLPDGTDLQGCTHHTGNKYAYNDGDGSTCYDVEYPLQIGGFDPNFHEEHIAVQPLPFAPMDDNYR